MSFFYHSGLGAVYFFALALVCLYGAWRGDREYRIFSLCVAGVFLCDRILLLTESGDGMMLAGGFVELIALLVVLLFVDSRAARFMAFLFAAKIAAYISLVGGAIGFQTMAAWTELAGYLQLITITGGTYHANRGKRSGYSGTLRPGITGVLHTGKGWLSPKRRS